MASEGVETAFGIFSFYDMGTYLHPNKLDGNSPQSTPWARPLGAREAPATVLGQRAHAVCR